ncbi:nacht lrr and card domains-containing [Anaeramoeba flamelloides]|uniref:Nacht lrr and card domains-containing n=1 Tax=Anaeramoeba flamelloides TaxID=1746091 RepID=A0AAV7ZLD0_9EUKA|nr:nacht lrr and card domains-containing [Anaeramoeba flamelloides]
MTNETEQLIATSFKYEKINLDSLAQPIEGFSAFIGNNPTIKKINLNFVDLRSENTIDDELIKTLTENKNQIESLKLYGSLGVTSVSILVHKALNNQICTLKHLDLGWNDLNLEMGKELLTIFKKGCRLTTLIIESCSLNDDYIQPLSEGLRQFDTLKFINFGTNRKLTGRGIIKINNALQNHKGLEVLNMSQLNLSLVQEKKVQNKTNDDKLDEKEIESRGGGNGNGGGGNGNGGGSDNDKEINLTVSLCNLLKSLKKLKKFKIDLKNSEDDSLILLIKTISGMNTIKTLRLGVGNDLGVKVSKYLASYLNSSQSLKQFIWNDYFQLPPSEEEIFSIFYKKNNLKKIRFFSINKETVLVKAFSKVKELNFQNSLTSIYLPDLNFKQISNWDLLFKGLASLKQLKSLNLEHSNYPIDGLRGFLKEGNSALKSINLSTNYTLKGTLLTDLLNTIKDSTSIRQLTLNRITFDDSSIKTLKKLITEMQCLKTISINQCDLTIQNFDTLYGAFSQNPNLQKIDYYDNHISSEQFEKILNLLDHNLTLNGFQISDTDSQFDFNTIIEFKKKIERNKCFAKNRMIKEFLAIYNQNLNADCSILNKFPINKSFVQLRTKKTIDELNQVLLNFSEILIKNFLIWVYTGIVIESKELFSIFKLLDLTSIQNMSLQQFLLDLYKKNESKDFLIIIKDDDQIEKRYNHKHNHNHNHNHKHKHKKVVGETMVVEKKKIVKVEGGEKEKEEEKEKGKGKGKENEKENEKEKGKENENEKGNEKGGENEKVKEKDQKKGREIKIPVHKFLLQFRSGLFQDLFKQFRKEKLNFIHDYSEKGIDSLKIFVQYLYTNEIMITGDNDSELIWEELKDANQYYQLYKPKHFLRKLQKKIFEKEK